MLLSHWSPAPIFHPTVAIQTAAIAELSIGSLIRLIQAPEQQASMVLAPPTQLDVRASTGPQRIR
ncbi:hypothetical protein [Paraburkholderia sediminicola]|uniref:hypothetical protein n=1 Tax=Paraburkholderia sediminicola TaxID=458836 RepID=UPI0038BC105B